MHQFWAQAIALKLKRYETRSWQPDHTAYGPLAIHAGKTITDEYRELFRRDPFKSLFAMHGLANMDDLPRGCVLGVCRLVKCHAVEDIRDGLSAQERAFGDFSDGRFAWELADVLAFQQPVPERGLQKIWSWKYPDNLDWLIKNWEREHGMAVLV